MGNVNDTVISNCYFHDMEAPIVVNLNYSQIIFEDSQNIRIDNSQFNRTGVI